MSDSRRHGGVVLAWMLATACLAAEIETDVCVVGGGCGGMGAAIAAVREGAQVVLVEKQSSLGGTGTAGLVCMWGGTPAESIAKELFDTLHDKGRAGVAKRLGKVPYHCWTIDPTLTYSSSLRARANRVVFEPHALSDAALGILRSHGATVMLDSTFEEAQVDGSRVTSIGVRRGNGAMDRVRAKVFIDATGDVYLCRAAGCETRIGKSLNGVTLCYRVRKGGLEDAAVLAAKPFKRTSCNHQLPNGDRIINMLPTVIGDELLKLGYEKTLEKCRGLVLRHWAWLRNGPGTWAEYRFFEPAPMLGIREGYRVVGEYVLTAADLEAGYARQQHADMIALSAHGVDVHGARKGVEHVSVRPYGIPYRCLIPKGWSNLLVACRGASFDRVAASSARLQRTVMWLGHAAGVGAAMAVQGATPVGAVDVRTLVGKVGMTPAEVKAMLSDAPGAGNAEPVVTGTKRRSFYCTDNGQGKILKFDESGACVWEFPAPRCQDVWALPNGNVLFSTFTDDGGVAKEVAPDKTVVWESRVKGAVHACQRLPDGNTAIGECGACRVIIVSPEGTIVQETLLVTKVENPHYHMRHMRVARNGHIFVSHPKESVVREYAPDGTVVREIRNVGAPFSAVPLPNGNVLVAGGGKCMVTEVAPDGKVVWRLTAGDMPEVNYKWAAGVQRLRNGNTVICNWLGHGQYGKGTPVFEVTPDKRVVWAFTDSRATRSVSSVCVLDDIPPIR